MSYAELDARANALAHDLVERGVQPGQRVGVLGGRSAAAIVAFLAVLKTGSAYVPLDPAHPAARRTAMAVDARLAALVVLPGHRPALADAPPGIPTIAFDPDRARPDGPPASPRRDDDDLACVLFTSGTTGRPKAVGIRHAGVTRLAADPRLVTITGEDRVLHLAALHVRPRARGDLGGIDRRRSRGDRHRSPAHLPHRAPPPPAR